MTTFGGAVLPGDTILSLGTGTHSRAIKEISGGEYSHATISTGAHVIEATLPRVHEIPVETLAGKSEYLDAFRHREAEGRAEAIVEAARAMVARDYSRTDLIVASALGTFTAWIQDKSSWLAYNTQYAVGRLRPFASQLRELYDAFASGSLTCVELVVRAHLRAGLPVEVRLDPGGSVDFGLLRHAIRSLYDLNQKAGKILESELGNEAVLENLEADAEWAAGIQRQVQNALAATGPRIDRDDLEAKVSVLKELVISAGDDTWDPALVTPNQVAKSASFVKLGRL